MEKSNVQFTTKIKFDNKVDNILCLKSGYILVLISSYSNKSTIYLFNPKSFNFKTIYRQEESKDSTYIKLINELDNGDIAIIFGDELKMYEIKEDALKLKNMLNLKYCFFSDIYFIWLLSNITFI
jgi:hypothetical protein